MINQSEQQLSLSPAQGGLRRTLTEEVRRDVEHITDGLGMEIDAGIREGVAVLNALGVTTTQSCEGHLDRGSPSPYIDIEAPDRPNVMFEGEVQNLQALAQKYSLDAEEIRSWPLDEERARLAEQAYNEHFDWMRETSPDYTPAYKKWKELDDRYRAGIARLVGEFYAARPKPSEGHVLLDHGRLRTSSDLYDTFAAAALADNGRSLSSDDRERLRGELPVLQAEMRAFIDFLKDKFIERAPSADARHRT